MTIHINGMGYQVNATEDLTNAKFKVITLLGTIAQAAGPRAVAGVCVYPVTSGYTATAIVNGITKALVGAAVNSLGAPLKVANSGFLTPASSGDVSCARALNTASSGDLLEVLFDAFNTAPTGA